MKKLLIIAMLFAAPFITVEASQPKSELSSAKKECKKQKKADKKAQKKLKKEQVKAKKAKHKESDNKLKAWLKQKKKDDKNKVATIYWSPDKGYKGYDRVPRGPNGDRIETNLADRVPRDSGGNRIDTSIV